MGANLDDYRRKRDFGRTPEPRPGRGRDRGGSLEFVVHRHEARRLHYDLRLEIGGALESWAVPRGLSYDPGDKRLAVHTEPHPLTYLTFEGVIPKGQYGAGTMGIWDRGSWSLVPGYGDDPAAAVEHGELKFVLRGRRLRGEWHLVRTKGDDGNWLLFKAGDRYARRGGLCAVDMDLTAARPARGVPSAPRAMRPAGTAEPFSDPHWVFELEFAGRRGFAIKDGERIRWRGLGRALAARIPDAVTAELSALRAERAAVDGVLVALDDRGRPSEDALNAFAAGRPDDAQLFFYAFDLVHFDGLDLRGLPLLDRKAALRAVLPPGRRLLYVDHLAGSGDRLADSAAELGLPALIAKRSSSSYAAGAREDWVRIPIESRDRGRSLAEAVDALEERSARPRKGFSNLDKVYWPEHGYTKGDLLDYYEAAGELLLPYLEDRPLHLNRFPDGIHGKSFYQKALRGHAQDWIRTFEYAGSDGETHELPVCDDLRTLLYLVNLGSIDLHPWLSRCGSPEVPDWVVFDLDPKEAPFSDVVKIAKTIGRVLRGIGLRPCLKTSGKTGLHIHVPLVPEYDYEQARMFAEAVARVVVREHADCATIERDLRARGGKVYVDFLQNRRGQTVVPPYVIRPVVGALASAPLMWDELDGDLDPRAFDMVSLPARVAELGDLFRPTLTDPQSLVSAIDRLAEVFA